MPSEADFAAAQQKRIAQDEGAVRVGVVRVVRSSIHRLQVQGPAVPGKRMWLDRLMLHSTSAVHELGDEGDLVLKRASAVALGVTGLEKGSL